MTNCDQFLNPVADKSLWVMLMHIVEGQGLAVNVTMRGRDDNSRKHFHLS